MNTKPIFEFVILPAIALTSLILFAAVETAIAKPARCFTTDEGHYDCQFKSTGKDGSFEITANGKPKFILNMDSPGVASGFADFGTGRNVFLPGQYIRQIEDSACWENTETKSKICAW